MRPATAAHQPATRPSIPRSLPQPEPAERTFPGRLERQDRTACGSQDKTRPERRRSKRDVIVARRRLPFNTSAASRRRPRQERIVEPEHPPRRRRLRRVRKPHPGVPVGVPARWRHGPFCRDVLTTTRSPGSSVRAGRLLELVTGAWPNKDRLRQPHRPLHPGHVEHENHFRPRTRDVDAPDQTSRTLHRRDRRPRRKSRLFGYSPPPELATASSVGTVSPMEEPPWRPGEPHPMRDAGPRSIFQRRLQLPSAATTRKERPNRPIFLTVCVFLELPASRTARSQPNSARGHIEPQLINDELAQLDLVQPVTVDGSNSANSRSRCSNRRNASVHRRCSAVSPRPTPGKVRGGADHDAATTTEARTPTAARNAPAETPTLRPPRRRPPQPRGARDRRPPRTQDGPHQSGGNRATNYASNRVSHTTHKVGSGPDSSCLLPGPPTDHDRQTQQPLPRAHARIVLTLIG